MLDWNREGNRWLSEPQFYGRKAISAMYTTIGKLAVSHRHSQEALCHWLWMKSFFQSVMECGMNPDPVGNCRPASLQMVFHWAGSSAMSTMRNSSQGQLMPVSSSYWIIIMHMLGQKRNSAKNRWRNRTISCRRSWTLMSWKSFISFFTAKVSLW